MRSWQLDKEPRGTKVMWKVWSQKVSLILFVVLVWAVLGGACDVEAPLELQFYYPRGITNSEPGPFWQERQFDTIKLTVFYDEQSAEDPVLIKRDGASTLGSISCKKLTDANRERAYILAQATQAQGDGKVLFSGRLSLQHVCRERKARFFLSPPGSYTPWRSWDAAKAGASNDADKDLFRVGHQVTKLPDGRFLITGGVASFQLQIQPDAKVSFAIEKWRNQTWLFAPASQTFTKGPLLKQGRAFHAAVLIDQQVHLIGGLTSAGGSATQPIQEITTIDVGSLSVATKPYKDLPGPPRVWGLALGDLWGTGGSVTKRIFGGLPPDTTSDDPGVPSVGRMWHTATYIPKVDAVIVAGGVIIKDGKFAFPEQSIVYANDTVRQNNNSTKINRLGHAAVWDEPNSSLLLVGGITNNGSFSGSSWWRKPTFVGRALKVQWETSDPFVYQVSNVSISPELRNRAFQTAFSVPARGGVGGSELILVGGVKNDRDGQQIAANGHFRMSLRQPKGDRLLQDALPVPTLEGGAKDGQMGHVWGQIMLLPTGERVILGGANGIESISADKQTQLITYTATHIGSHFNPAYEKRFGPYPEPLSEPSSEPQQEPLSEPLSEPSPEPPTEPSRELGPGDGGEPAIEVAPDVPDQGPKLLPTSSYKGCTKDADCAKGSSGPQERCVSGRCMMPCARLGTDGTYDLGAPTLRCEAGATCTRLLLFADASTQPPYCHKTCDASLSPTDKLSCPAVGSFCGSISGCLGFCVAAPQKTGTLKVRNAVCDSLSTDQAKLCDANLVLFCAKASSRGDRCVQGCDPRVSRNRCVSNERCVFNASSPWQGICQINSTLQQEGEPCDDSKVCDRQLVCNGGTCKKACAVSKGAVGNGDCGSGAYCSFDFALEVAPVLGVCEPLPASPGGFIELGNECSTWLKLTNCNDKGVCLDDPTKGKKTCRQVCDPTQGSSGCLTNQECVVIRPGGKVVGHKGGVCVPKGTQKRYEVCGELVSRCVQGLTCVSGFCQTSCDLAKGSLDNPDCADPSLTPANLSACICTDAAVGGVCVRRCDPRLGGVGNKACPAKTYCSAYLGGFFSDFFPGLCTRLPNPPTKNESKKEGELCNPNSNGRTECEAGLTCIASRCMRPCEPGKGSCAADEVCAESIESYLGGACFGAPSKAANERCDLFKANCNVGLKCVGWFRGSYRSGRCMRACNPKASGGCLSGEVCDSTTGVCQKTCDPADGIAYHKTCGKDFYCPLVSEYNARRGQCYPLPEPNSPKNKEGDFCLSGFNNALEGCAAGSVCIDNKCAATCRGADDAKKVAAREVKCKSGLRCVAGRQASELSSEGGFCQKPSEASGELCNQSDFACKSGNNFCDNVCLKRCERASDCGQGYVCERSKAYGPTVCLKLCSLSANPPAGAFRKGCPQGTGCSFGRCRPLPPVQTGELGDVGKDCSRLEGAQKNQRCSRDPHKKLYCVDPGRLFVQPKCGTFCDPAKNASSPVVGKEFCFPDPKSPLGGVLSVTCNTKQTPAKCTCIEFDKASQLGGCMP